MKSPMFTELNIFNSMVTYVFVIAFAMQRRVRGLVVLHFLPWEPCTRTICDVPYAPLRDSHGVDSASLFATHLSFPSFCI